MTEIKRETDISIVDKIKDNFVEDGDYTREVIAEDLICFMTKSPDDTCVLVGYEDGEIVGHLVAWIPDCRSYVWLGQAWHDSKNGSEVAKQGFKELEKWAKERGYNEIRFETERSRMSIGRSWGFEEHAVVMTKRINNDG